MQSQQMEVDGRWQRQAVLSDAADSEQNPTKVVITSLFPWNHQNGGDTCSWEICKQPHTSIKIQSLLRVSLSIMFLQIPIKLYEQSKPLHTRFNANVMQGPCSKVATFTYGGGLKLTDFD